MSNQSLPQILTLGALRCEISPALGGCIAGLRCADIPVLRSTPAAQLQSVRLSGSYPLVPYSNRQAFAQMQWEGAQYPLAPNFAPSRTPSTVWVGSGPGR